MREVSFGMCWQVYGRQSLILPDDIDVNDTEAVKAYINQNSLLVEWVFHEI